MDCLVKDFLSLPIFISDYNALVTPTAEARQHFAYEELQTPQALDVNAGADDEPIPAVPAGWNTGFYTLTEAIWRCMTGQVRRKLRDACVEVLRRTEEDGFERVMQSEQMRWRDDDARFLG